MCKRSFGCVVLTAMVVSSLGVFMASGADTTKATVRDPATERVEINLEKLKVSWEDFPKVVFAKDGKEVCVWWGLGDIHRLKFLVFDLAGKNLGSSRDTNALKLLTGFPTIAWKWIHYDFLHPPGRGVTAETFSTDLSEGFRVSLANKLPESGDRPYVAEMWRLSEPKRQLWSRELPEGEQQTYHPEAIGILHDWRSEPLLIALNTVVCAELDPQTGSTKRTFAFGPIESSEEAGKRAKKFGGSEDDQDLAGFSAGSFDYDPKHGWIACGCSHDRRIRVIDSSAPQRVVFEAHNNDNPFRPRGGNWFVYPVEFFVDGKYLVASTDFSRRFGPYKYEIEVYETTSWRMVWKTEDNRIQSFALSPDGQNMAYVRAATLVIARFEPKPLGPAAKSR